VPTNRHRDAIARQNLTSNKQHARWIRNRSQRLGIGVLRFHQNIDVVCRQSSSSFSIVNSCARRRCCDSAFAMPGTARKSLAAAPITALAEPKWAISALRSRGPMPGREREEQLGRAKIRRSLRRHHASIVTSGFTQCQRTGNACAELLFELQHVERNRIRTRSELKRLASSS